MASAVSTGVGHAWLPAGAVEITQLQHRDVYVPWRASAPRYIPRYAGLMHVGQDWSQSFWLVCLVMVMILNSSMTQYVLVWQARPTLQEPKRLHYCAILAGLMGSAGACGFDFGAWKQRQSPHESSSEKKPVVLTS